MIAWNYPYILATSLIPLLVGAIYYSPMLFGNAWMRISGVSEGQLKSGSMLKIFGLTFLLGLFLAVFFIPTVLHANHVFSLVAQAGGGPIDPASQSGMDAQAFFDKYGGNFRTFGHGAFHGILSAIFCIWPVLAINSMFERRGWRYTAIHFGYWLIVFALMGGAVCAVA